MANRGLKKTVLVVDDEPSVRGILKRYLEYAGYTPVLASTGQEGLTLLAGLEPGQLLIAFLDLGLPDMEGLEVLKKMKAMRPALPVIVITGRNDEDNSMSKAAIELGAQDFLVKPFSLQALVQNLDSFVAKT